MMKGMAIYRKTRILKQGLGRLDQHEMDYIGNLSKSLLNIQNDDFINDDFINDDFTQKPEGLRKVKHQAKRC